MPGDVPGSGSSKLSNTGSIDSADKCAEYCNKNKDCGSYEFSPSELRCNVNTESEPTSKKIYKDYQFCSKKKTGKHAGFIRYEPVDVRTTVAPATSTTLKAAAAQQSAAKSAEAQEAASMEEAIARAIGKQPEEEETPLKPVSLENEIAAPQLSADTSKWSLSVFFGTAIGFTVGYLFATVDGLCCRKRQEYASLLGH